MNYTIGQIANLTGCTAKAIRLYEKKGLFHVEHDMNNGYRYFNEDTLLQIQRIQMLKYLGFSLNDIKEYLTHFDEISVRDSFREQKKMLERRRFQLNSAIACVERAANECDSNMFSIDKFFHTMKSIYENQKADDCVFKLSRLVNEPQGWSEWIFDQADIKAGSQVMDCGAGWGNLWRFNSDRIPERVQIDCIDQHNNHCDTFEQYVQSNGWENFDFVWGNCEIMEMKKEYDVIFFNHVIQFMKEPERMFEKLARWLTPSGKLICTWGGGLLFTQISELIRNGGVDAPLFEAKYNKFQRSICDREAMLNRVFSDVERREYRITITFEHVEDLLDYLASPSYLGKENIENHNQLRKYIEQRWEREGGLSIQRDTYLYKCQKGE